MAELLVEVGVEELPSSFVASGRESLEAAARAMLAAQRLSHDGLEVLGTPRRLALRVRGLPSAQADRRETVTGPPWTAAFRDGEPTKAAVGFARKNGVPVTDLAKVETDKGPYVAAEVHEVGRPTAEVLAAELPAALGRIAFRKAMRWGEGEHAFGRPVQWLVVLLDEEVVPVSFAGLDAGRLTRGHRFLAPSTFVLASAAEYEDRLRDARVVADVAARTALMNERLGVAASALGGTLVDDAHLEAECASMVEEPFVVPGTFDEAFLALPDALVISVMRDHQFYFALRDGEGRLMNRYLNVVNTAEAPALIAKGNDRVLRARLADAQFFVTEDQKQPLEARLPKLDTVTFHSKLGSVGQKVGRVARIAERLAADVGVDADLAGRAARLAKADLETLIVFEFPDLQGLMGRHYALREGLPEELADAIRDHYRPAGGEDDPPDAPLAAVVGLAARADTLVGCFGVGLEPKGSNDPFALRRAALGIVRTLLEGPVDVGLTRLVDLAAAELTDAGHFDDAALEGQRRVLEFVRARLRALFREAHRGDLVDAALAAWWEEGSGDLDGGLSPRDLRARLVALEAFRERPEFDDLATAFKRAFNIAKDAARGAVDPHLLEAGAEADLAEAFTAAGPIIREALDARDYTVAFETVATGLKAPIDRFFDEVFVMVDDPRLRTNRLRLLAAIADTVNAAAHLHLLAPA